VRYIYSETNLSAMIIDIYSTNVTLEWKNFSISICEKSSIMNVHLFECELPVNYLEVIDTSCLQEKTLNYDDKICFPTTIRPIESTTQAMKPIYECPDKNYIGPHCDILNDICQLYDCEEDNKICKNNTCWYVNYSFQIKNKN
jgi:hypothetical protein